MLNRHENIFWLIAGIISLGLVFGWLTGASQSPVSGIVITSIFGLLVAFIGLSQKKKDNESSLILTLDNKKLNQIGKITLTFNLFFITGIFLGMSYRHYGYFESPKNFIWKNSSLKPPTAEDAIHWVVITDILKERNYNEFQIRNLYEQYMQEIKKNPDISPCKDFIKMLIAAPHKEPSRGPASEN